MIYPGAAWKPVPNHSGKMTEHLGLILHVQQGTGGLQGWFSNPAAQASSTWWVSRSGAVEQYVDAELKAWAQGAGNAAYNSVETEGFDRDPLTDAQIRALADLYAWGHATYGWPLGLAEKPGDRGFGWHGMGGTEWGGHFGCPGDLRKPQRVDVLALIAQPPSEEDIDMLICQDPRSGGWWLLFPNNTRRPIEGGNSLAAYRKALKDVTGLTPAEIDNYKGI